tara:strand:+ start:8048 stop:9475 length:1428 start_codon:yes stop_codon:yes gene_type:complete
MSDFLKLYIDGQWVGNADNEKIAVINPATEDTINHICAATDENLMHAVRSAEKAFKKWAFTPATERSKILASAVENLDKRREAIADGLTREQGKPIGEAMGEVQAAIQSFAWAAAQALQIKNITYEDDVGNYTQQSNYEPIGIVAGFSPWNFPIMLTARKIAAALAAGCCIIIKPAEEAPASALALAQALDEAGLPRGVLNMVFGDPEQISTALINQKSVRKVSLTGSSAVGKKLAKIAADTLTPCVLELGGHAPVLVFDDADVDNVAKNLAIFKYRNAGQVCISPSRFFIHKNIFETFCNKFIEYASALVVGDGADQDTSIGPLAHERRLESVDALVSDAKNKGARCLLGGHKLNRSGYFYAPTVLTDVPENAELLKTEIFGPVAVLADFEDLDDVILRANDVPYGLASYIFTKDQKMIDYVKPRLEVGLVSINITTPIRENVPFGGVKESGYGYEGGEVGLHSFLHSKLIHKA